MNEDRRLTQQGAELIKHFEGCLKKRGDKYHAYECPAGVLTIGWGHTNHHGRKFNADAKWSLAECNEAAREDMETFEMAVRRLVTVPLAYHEFDALVSFVYNVGEGNFKKSTLLKKVNAGDFEGAAREFKRWNKANGKVLAGLTRRRESESLMFQNIQDLDYDGTPDERPDPMPQAVDEPEE
jgi:lysozyme